MDTAYESQRTKQEIFLDDYLEIWEDAFLVDRQAAGLSPKSISFYKTKLDLFNRYAKTQLIKRIFEITPDTLRQYLLWLAAEGHNPGGVHAGYRTIRAFLKWYEDETEPDNWRNPIKRVKAPRVDIPPLEPVSMEMVTKLLESCRPRGRFLTDRDRAIILALLDTGCRAGEMLNLEIDDLNIASGAILIRKSKSRKPRTVFLGAYARKAMRAYLRHLQSKAGPLWLTRSRMKMDYAGLRSMIRRRTPAGMKEPSLHSFRRAFALSMLRSGADVFSLKQLLGHSDMEIMKRYLATDSTDSKRAHNLGSPVDRLLAK
jgi:integrase/recombinase XerD